jgi:hypothetical protein
VEVRKSQGKLRLVIQPTIIRIYKVAGILALGAILIGLFSFVVVNVFYFFNHTWVRPVVLSPTHQKVIDASTSLADARLRASQFETERLEVAAEIAQIDRVVAIVDKFLIDVSALPGAMQRLHSNRLKRACYGGKSTKQPWSANMPSVAVSHCNSVPSTWYCASASRSNWSNGSPVLPTCAR